MFKIHELWRTSFRVGGKMIKIKCPFVKVVKYCTSLFWTSLSCKSWVFFTFSEEKVVVIICSDGGITSQNEEKAITGRIKQLLDDEGIILWWKDYEHPLAETKNLKRAFQLNRSKALPDDSVAKRSMGSKPRSINAEEITLNLKTRLYRGRISYQEMKMFRKDSKDGRLQMS